MTAKLRIVSDGTPSGTRVLCPKGDPLPHVTRIEIQPITPEGLVTAAITFANVELDIDAKVTLAALQKPREAST